MSHSLSFFFFFFFSQMNMNPQLETWDMAMHLIAAVPNTHQQYLPMPQVLFFLSWIALQIVAARLEFSLGILTSFHTIMLDFSFLFLAWLVCSWNSHLMICLLPLSFFQSPKLVAQREFISALIAVGKRLTSLPTKELKSEFV